MPDQEQIPKTRLRGTWYTPNETYTIDAGTHGKWTLTPETPFQKTLLALVNTLQEDYIQLKKQVVLLQQQLQQQQQAQAVTVHNTVSVGDDVRNLIAALVQQTQRSYPPIVDTIPVSRAVQTHHQTQATPASKASKRCVSGHTPDTLADTPAFRQCVEHGMSRTALAKRFGVSESTIARAKRKLQR